jgi:DNA gyrase/topoisomerase IV subunit B
MTEYSAKDVRVLEEVEHIRLNPGMYIGETTNPVHLIEEALDNALDEALAGYAKIIAVLINTKKNEFSVLDNGRGIPIEENTPVTVSSKLFSGAKFQDKKSAYQISSGLHGVGLVAVNALSSEYIVEVYRNGKHAKYHFKSTKLFKTDINSFSEKAPFSTKIQFIPDKKFFETLTPDLQRIRRRLTTASAELPDDIKLVLTIDDSTEVFSLTILDNFKSILNSEPTAINLSSVKGPEKFDVLFAYDESGPSQKIISSVNLLPVDGGGTHLLAFQDLLKEFFVTKAKKFGYAFQPNDSLVGLRAYLILNLIEPKFSGQTKDKLTNRKTQFIPFINILRNQLETLDEDFLKSLLEKFQEYRRKLDAKKLVRNGSTSNRASTKFTKLRDCSSRLGELFIVEGDSAGGSIIQSRDPRKHAILPLKGKSIPNVTMKKDIIQNKEVGELIKALGTGVGPHFDLSKLRYSRIICATDADPDGAHIACLLTMVMGILLPEIIKAGKYFIAQTPLFAINEKKIFKPLWNDDQLKKAREEKKEIQRYKGLGEMNPSQLKVCLLDEQTRNLIPVNYSQNIDELVKLFSSSDEKRKLVSE